ncbi:mercuric reductase [Candidatus Peregrinibacteria bacterium]|nr:mercuric reductase [Candidatus Peregrinibacteria bacterium]
MGKYDLIVIGAGSGGLVAAVGANYIGAKVLLIEKEKLGGDCLNYGCVPSKAIIKSAAVSHYARNAKNYGIKLDNLQTDFPEVIKRVQSIVQGIATTHDSKERFESLGIKVLMGNASFMSDHEIQVHSEMNNETVSYYGKKIVIASGGRPNVPPIEGLAESAPLTNLNIFSLEKQPEHLVVLGGGPIGAELSQAFRRLGSRVTMIIKGQLLPREDKDAAKLLHKQFEKEGVELIEFVDSIDSVKKEGMQKSVSYTKDGKSYSLKGDQVLASLGRIPNVEGLNLESCGVEYGRRGIMVNNRMQTNVRHIYACGDICGPYQFTHLASYQAGIIIKNAFTPLKTKADYKAFPWCTYTDPEVAHVGMSDSELKSGNIEHKKYKFDLHHVDRAKSEGETAGFIKIAVKKNGEILGVTIVAPHAGELLPEYTLALRKGLKVSDIYDTVHSYPTMSELNKFVIGEYMKEKFTPSMKKFLKWWNGFSD